MKAVSFEITTDDWNVIVRIGIDVGSWLASGSNVWTVARMTDLNDSKLYKDSDFSVYLDGKILYVVVALGKKMLKTLVGGFFGKLWGKISHV